MSEKVNPYLKTQVMTASREQLQLMLYDGAIRFCAQAKAKIDEKDYEASYTFLVKAQKIILALLSGLRKNISPSLCEKLASLYNFIYRRLVEANLARDKAKIDDAIKVLSLQRDIWAELMEKITDEGIDTSALEDTVSEPGSNVHLRG